MKKFLLILLILFVIGITAIYFVGGTVLNKGIQTVVVKYGPALTGTEIELAEVNISLLSGEGSISGLVIGNPAGFSTEKAFSMAKSELKIVPGSLLSETIEIKRILIDAPEIVLERANGTTNLQQIQKNITAAAQSEAETPDETPEEEPAIEEPSDMKLSIEEFVLSNATLTLALMGQNQTVKLPTIRLTNLGTEQGGVPPAEISKEVMSAILKAASQAATEFGMSALQDPGKALESATGQLEKLSEKADGLLGGFLKKKEAKEESAE